MLNQKFRDFSVLNKNRIIFSIVLIITLCCYGLVFYYSAKQKSDSLLVDISGKNRMLSQRIGAMSQLVGCADLQVGEKAKEELTKAIAAHTAALKVLKEGGYLTGIDEELPAASPKIKIKIEEIQEFFEKHKELANILVTEPRYVSKAGDTTQTFVPNPNFDLALKEMQTRLINGTLLKYNVELTNMFVEKSSDTKASFFILLVILMFLNVGVIVLGYKLFHNYVTTPVNYLSGISAKIAEGDAGVHSSYQSGDDIGRISDSINILTSNLRKAANFTMRLGKGDFGAELDIIVANNTSEEQNLALSLLNMKSNMVEMAAKDQKRKWVAEGLARFADILRNNHEVKMFAEVAVVELVKYVNANQAGLFVANGEGENLRLEMKACYAYERKKYIDKSFAPGDGLVGQAFLEKGKIYLTEVPNDYVRITSGLGDATPKCILILPLSNNDRIEGVLEIASFQRFDEFEIQFLEKAAENIASALYHIKINEHTRRLLEASQQQSEELRAQEEEMRQNMEELSATQEEVSRKETHYLKMIDELRAELGNLKAA